AVVELDAVDVAGEMEKGLRVTGLGCDDELDGVVLKHRTVPFGDACFQSLGAYVEASDGHAKSR
ncbi:MAG TPA: hypothetical protein DIT01_18860, partial [Lentisphaeria bacterium]|nr:hypothetical protein [Lentisphaeria bacterium]